MSKRAAIPLEHEHTSKHPKTEQAMLPSPPPMEVDTQPSLPPTAMETDSNTQPSSTLELLGSEHLPNAKDLQELHGRILDHVSHGMGDNTVTLLFAVQSCCSGFMDRRPIFEIDEPYWTKHRIEIEDLCNTARRTKDYSKIMLISALRLICRWTVLTCNIIRETPERPSEFTNDSKGCVSHFRM